MEQKKEKSSLGTRSIRVKSAYGTEERVCDRNTKLTGFGNMERNKEKSSLGTRSIRVKEHALGTLNWRWEPGMEDKSMR